MQKKQKIHKFNKLNRIMLTSENLDLTYQANLIMITNLTQDKIFKTK